MPNDAAGHSGLDSPPGQSGGEEGEETGMEGRRPVNENLACRYLAANALVRQLTCTYSNVMEGMRADDNSITRRNTKKRWNCWASLIRLDWRMIQGNLRWTRTAKGMSGKRMAVWEKEAAELIREGRVSRCVSSINKEAGCQIRVAGLGGVGMCMEAYQRDGWRGNVRAKSESVQE